MDDRFIVSGDDVMDMLDTLLDDRGGTWWNGFFADRGKPCPFFVDRRDENLVEWFDAGVLAPGRVLELGAGNGRNAVHLARAGCGVDAVDFSAEALAWATERASAADVRVNFQYCSLFDATFADRAYDSGCFHHLAPHRRRDYVELVRRALRPGGHLGLVCFRPEGGSGYTDHQVYERRSLGGGPGYTEGRLRALWDIDPFTVRVLRRMARTEGRGSRFGEDFLWTLLARKADSA